MSHRPDFWPDGMGVFDMVMALHGDACGSSDPLPDEKRVLYVRCLHWLAWHWQQPTSRFDRAVRKLIHHTLAEQRAKYAKPIGKHEIRANRAHRRSAPA